IAPVASVLASSAMATFPPARRSPMIPDPTTAARRNAVPRNSATARRPISIVRFAASPRLCLRFDSANKRAHKLALYLRRDGVHINARTDQELSRILNVVDTSG